MHESSLFISNPRTSTMMRKMDGLSRIFLIIWGNLHKTSNSTIVTVNLGKMR